MLYDINLPEIKETSNGDNNSTFTIEPLYPGYGMTLGNSMRRVLLSSLAGCAITGVKIEGVSHEFSTIEGVREDVIEIILNLKQVRFSMDGEEKVTVSLKKSGKGEVTAADIKVPAGVEVKNPEQVIANLDTAKSKLEMDLLIDCGRGYVAVESRGSEQMPVGMIAIDAIYTPIKRVRYNVENTRVGQMTNLDKLILDVETDGSVSPLHAVQEAAQILVGHFQVLAGHDVVSVGTGGIITAEQKQEADMAQISIDEVNFSPRTTNALLNNDIKTIKEIMELKPGELKELKGFGQKAYEEVLEKLEELGVNTNTGDEE